MRLFRQPTLADWEPPFAAMTGALQEHLRSGAPLMLDRPTPAEPLPTPTPPPAMREPRARDFSRFNRFLESIPAPPSPQLSLDPHASILSSTIESLHRDGLLKAGDRLLDMDCGQGQALEIFGSLGLRPTGLARGADVGICRGKGLDAVEMDQNFMDLPDGSFDVLWCRHTLDASVAPLFTLMEYRRVTRPGGLIYIEVAAPDTSAHHENDLNRHCVMNKAAWIALFARTDCVVERGWAINFNMSTGSDTYSSFVLRRPGGPT
jgi:SAM-dependent methyltransferase